MTDDIHRVDPGLDPSKANFIHPRAHSVGMDGTKVTVTARDHAWIIDEPKHKGGSDLGPSPLESLLGSLAGCETVVLRIVADAIGFEYSRVSIDCEGTADLRGARGVKGVRPYFTKVDMRIELNTGESDSRIDLLRRNVELRCPVMNLLKSADVELNIDWIITPNAVSK